jgi:Tol biopolymer transport system component
MTRNRWIALGVLLFLGCLIVASLGLVYLSSELPVIAQLFRGLPFTSESGDATVTPDHSPAIQTSQPDSGWIAFESKRDGRSDYEVYVMATDGSRVTNLTESWADDLAPVWSPDGRRIAFVSLRDTAAGKWGLGPGSIYVMDFDPRSGAGGGALTRVTSQDTNDGWPTWSPADAPGGGRIAFHSERSGNWDIWAINLDGSELSNLTHHPGDDRFPAWSPDGTKIAFTSKRDGNHDIWVMNADGSDPVNISQARGRDQYPMWSPDGSRIAFNTKRDGNLETYVMNANGSDQVNVTLAPDSTEGLADWSPDGLRLVLYSDRSGNKEVYIVDLASGEWINISSNPGSDEFSTWSP